MSCRRTFGEEARDDLSTSISYALLEGKIVHVSDVPSGKSSGCRCPACSGLLVANKGNVRRHHFSHESNSACDGESVLHLTSKLILKQRLEESIRTGAAARVQWTCACCRDQHGGNLVKRARSVRMEADLGPARADLLLEGEGGSPLAALEIVVSHHPSPKALEFYRQRRLPLFLFDVKTWYGAHCLRTSETLRALGHGVCRRELCGGCGTPLRTREYRLVDGPCPHCRKEMRWYVLRSESPIFPSRIRRSDIRSAVEAGCVVKAARGAGGSDELLNHCRSCDRPSVLLDGEGFSHLALHPAGKYCFSCGH